MSKDEPPLDVFSVTARCEQLFPGQGTARARLWRAKQLQYSLLRTVITPTAHGRLPDARSLSGRGTRIGDVETARAATRHPVERFAHMLQAATERAGIGALLDETISADTLGVFKPSPRVYKLAYTRLKVAAGRLGFVSSNSWDIAGAASVGLTTFWMQRHVDEPAEELGFPATGVVTSLDDLATLLQ